MTAPKGNQFAIGNKGGRKPIYEPFDILEKFDQYVINEDYPTIEGFCSLINICRDTFYRLMNESEAKQELTDSKKRCDQKAEEYLQRNALHNKINPIFAMFTLKQSRFGWKDKQEIDTNINFNAADMIKKARSRVEETE